MQEMLLEISLLVIGFVLLAVEAFVIPGFGFAGIGGVLLVAGGCAMAWMTQGWAAGLAVIAVSLALTLTGLWLVARSRTAKQMVLGGYNPGESADTTSLRAIVGRTGVATSDLRPSGVAEIDGERHAVTTGGEWIEAGTRVRVTRVGTFNLFVEAAPDESDDTNPESTEAS